MAGEILPGKQIKRMVSCENGTVLFTFIAAEVLDELKKHYCIAVVFLPGDEGIEPPPKVLETPIIPFDQSPIFDFVSSLISTSYLYHK